MACCRGVATECLSQGDRPADFREIPLESNRPWWLYDSQAAIWNS